MLSSKHVEEANLILSLILKNLTEVAISFFIDTELQGGKATCPRSLTDQCQ